MDESINAVFATDAARWDALLRRDPRADGQYLYGVTTTGIYCRPTCASKRPRRDNVAFFAGHGEAERAGFRACKRCRPNLAAAPGRHADAVARACRLIEEAPEPPSLTELATAIGLNPSHFHRLFKATTGVTPRAYAAAHRQRRLQDTLRPGTSVTRTIFDAGFGSSSRFYDGAGAALGMTPSAYKDGALGIEIRVGFGRSSLGSVLVAATERGVCVIEIGEDRERLTERLRARFPHARLRDDDPAFAAWIDRVTALVETPRLGLDLPLDVQGTAFQRRVWEALRAIPAGATASYAEVAARIERPGAARAVAGACAANPLAVAIPCHRVLRRDGDLGGYRWGVERKRALLAREAAKAEPTATSAA